MVKFRAPLVATEHSDQQSVFLKEILKKIRKTVKGSEPKPTSKQETDGLDKTLKFRISSSQEKKLIFSGKVAASNRVLGVDHVSLKSKIATVDTDADADVVDADSKLEPSQCFFLTLTMKAHT